MEADGKSSTTFQESNYDSNVRPWNFAGASMEPSLLPFTSSLLRLHLLPLMLVEVSTEVVWMELLGLLWNAYGSTWAFVILVEVGGSM